MVHLVEVEVEVYRVVQRKLCFHIYHKNIMFRHSEISILIFTPVVIERMVTTTTTFQSSKGWGFIAKTGRKLIDPHIFQVTVDNTDGTPTTKRPQYNYAYK